MPKIVWNLLSNAIKFTPAHGEIRLILRTEDGKAIIQVQDTGEGITAEFLPVMFERFRQADGSTRRVRGGLGLGLAIVRQLVELQGGSITAASDGLGKGTTMTVTLPLTSLPTEPSAALDMAGWAGNRAEFASALHGVRLVLVDDDRQPRHASPPIGCERRRRDAGHVRR